MNKISLQNLKPNWQPGQSGNPLGRKHGSIGIKNRVRNALLSHDKEGKEKIDEMIAVFVKKALKGDVAAFKLLLEINYNETIEKEDLVTPGFLVRIVHPENDSKFAPISTAKNILKID